MSLLQSKWLRAAGYVAVALSVLSFTLHVTWKVFTGHGLDNYFSGTGVIWNYVGALVTLCVAALVGVVWIVLRLIHIFGQSDKNRKESGDA